MKKTNRPYRKVCSLMLCAAMVLQTTSWTGLAAETNMAGYPVIELGNKESENSAQEQGRMASETGKTMDTEAETEKTADTETETGKMQDTEAETEETADTEIETEETSDSEAETEKTAVTDEKETEKAETQRMSSPETQMQNSGTAVTAAESKTKVTIYVGASRSKYYDGKKFDYSKSNVSVRDYDYSGTFDFLYTGTTAAGIPYSSEEGPTDAGKYILTAKIPDTDPNYYGSGTSSINIMPKRFSITFPEQSPASVDELSTEGVVIENTNLIEDHTASVTAVQGHNDGTYSAIFQIWDEEGKDVTANYTPINKGTYHIYKWNTENHKKECTFCQKAIDTDNTAPTSAYQINGTASKAWETDSSAGLFSKNAVNMTITASDEQSGIKSIEYVIEKDGVSGEKQTYEDTAIRLSETGIYVIHVYVTDQAGNTLTGKSETIVIFEDSQATAFGTYESCSMGAVEIPIDFKGNTIKDVTYQGNTLTENRDYMLENNSISLLSGILEELAVSDTPYQFVIHYLPRGAEKGTTGYGDDPAQTTINLQVIKNKNGKVEFRTGSYKKTYDGNPISESEIRRDCIAESNGAWSFTYGLPGQTEGYTTTAPTAAGNYVVCVTVAADEIYEESKGYAEYIIEKAPVEIPVIRGAVYNGTHQIANVSSTEDYTVKEDNGGMDAGVYDVVVRLRDDANYKWKGTDGKSAELKLPFEIAKAENEWLVTPSIESWTYGEKAKAPKAEAKAGTVTITHTGSSYDGTIWNTKAPTKAGSYTVHFSVGETKNYKALSEKKVNYEIKKKELTVAISKKSSVYGNEIVVLAGVDDGGIISGDTNVYSLSTAASSSAAIGTYDITGTTLNPNYDITFTGGKDAYTITQREVTVDVDVADKQYDGLVKADIVKADLQNVVAADADQVDLRIEAKFASCEEGEDVEIVFPVCELTSDGGDAVLKNYKLIPPSGIKANITNTWNPEKDTEYTTSSANEKGWRNQDLVITAKEGYELSDTNTADGTWTSELTASEEGAESKAEFYVRNKATGAISRKVTEHYKLDKNTDTTGTTGWVVFQEVHRYESLQKMTFVSLYFDEPVVVTAGAADALSGVECIEFYETKQALSLEELQAVTAWTRMPADGVTVSVEDGKQFGYYIRITDQAGNITYLSTDGAEYDYTVPVLTGLEEGKVYYTTQAVHAADKNLESVFLSKEGGKARAAASEDVTEENEKGAVILKGNTNTTYRVEAVDKAGNRTVLTVEMKSLASLKDPIKDVKETNATDADKEKIKDVISKAEELLKEEHLTEEEKQELNDIRNEAEDLLERIAEAEKKAEEEAKKAEEAKKNEAKKEKETSKGDLKKNQDSKDSKDTKNIPSTGDHTNFWMWMVLLAVGGIGICMTAYRRKEKQ